MKIAFVISGKSISRAPGGLGTYAVSLATVFERLGYKVFVVGFSDTDGVHTVGQITAIHVSTPFGRLASLGARFICRSFARTMARIVEQELEESNPESIVVAGAGIWSLAGVWFRQQRTMQGFPIKTLAAYFTTYEHEYAGQLAGASAEDYGWTTCSKVWLAGKLAHFFFRPLEHSLLRDVDRILVHWQYARTIFSQEIAGLPPEKFAFIPYYVESYDREAVAQGGNQAVPGKFHIGCVCRQDPRKGINVLLKALKILKQQGIDYRCTIAGSGVFFEKNRELCRRLGLEEDVSFTGFVPSVTDLLAQMDLFVMSPFEEGSSSLSVLEAMKAGLPIVATDCDGIPEDIVHGKTGLLSPVGDSRSLALQISRLVEDRDLAERLGRNARSDYHTRYTMEGMEQGMAEVILSLSAEDKHDKY